MYFFVYQLQSQGTHIYQLADGFQQYNNDFLPSTSTIYSQLFRYLQETVNMNS